MFRPVPRPRTDRPRDTAWPARPGWKRRATPTCRPVHVPELRTWVVGRHLRSTPGVAAPPAITSRAHLLQRPTVSRGTTGPRTARASDPGAARAPPADPWPP